MFGDSCRVLEARTPDLLQQLLAAENTARVAGQEGEQLVFTRGEVNALTPNRNLAGTQVYGDISIDQRVVSVAGALRRRLHRTAAQPGTDPRDEFPQGVRLDHVVVGPELQADDTVDLLGPTGQHDHRYFAGLPQPTQDGESIHPRHRDIEHHKIDFSGLEELERGLTVRRLQDPIPEPFKASSKRNSRSFVILGDE